ncbi:hypothetical protein BDV41DRAFT_530219 [Aspergillus transmontanensis]|uniref:Uncharacterized protein n=1 Tax=Aspergillus transmontanensis TaxID=1034304 RepID=A0A5N6W4U2_9EURO|nr:hypothetical protein BDV41DRAFT_530219 [Aspergillus transmontanensis]
MGGSQWAPRTMLQFNDGPATLMFAYFFQILPFFLFIIGGQSQINKKFPPQVH